MFNRIKSIASRVGYSKTKSNKSVTLPIKIDNTTTYKGEVNDTKKPDGRGTLTMQNEVVDEYDIKTKTVTGYFLDGELDRKKIVMLEFYGKDDKLMVE
jgi:hypothetical protein